MKFFFQPNSVAVIGASTNPRKNGNIILKNIIDSNFKGKIYPINPTAHEVLGIKAYPTVMEIPANVDLAVIIVPAQICVQVLKDCAQKGIKGVIIEAMGFSEIGETGKRLQDEIMKIAETNGIRVMGPNCTGIVSRNLTTTFFPISNVPHGNVALFGQSGLLAAGMASDIIVNKSLNIHTICSIGNKCDVNENDLLDYFGKSPQVDVISMYLESIANGRKFLPIAKQVAANKPLILLIGGSTEAGAKAAMSHTGSIASNANILKAAIKQTGCIQADDFSELKDFAKVFSTQPIPKGNRVAIVTAAGSVGVVVSDLCVEHGLEISRLGSHGTEAMEFLFPPNMAPSNPVDLWYSIEKFGLMKTLETTIAYTLQDPNVDAMILILGGFKYTLPVLDHQTIQKITKKHNKPVVICMIVGHNEYKNRIMEELGKDLPIFTTLISGVKALSKLCEYGTRKHQQTS